MLALVVTLLTVPAQLIDPPCGTVVTDDDTLVEYTQDLDCSGASVALSISASNVFVEGNGNEISVGDRGIVIGGLGVSLQNLALDGGNVAVDLDDASLIVLDAVTIQRANVGLRGSADDVLLLSSRVAASFGCVELHGVGGELIIFDNDLFNCETGVRASFDPAALLEFTDNLLASGGGGLGLVLFGLDDALPLERNTVVGYQTVAAFVESQNIDIDLGSICGKGDVGVLVSSSNNVRLRGVLSGFDPAVQIQGTSENTTLALGFSGNGVAVRDFSVGPTLLEPQTFLDADADGTLDTCDLCPGVADAAQLDSDDDGAGDACDGVDDSDPDGDGEPNRFDNCPALANAEQDDFDGDGLGDACDPFNDLDDDDDGVLNVIDNCVFLVNEDQEDSDQDGFGDACDDIDNSGGGATTPPTPPTLISATPLAAGSVACPFGGTRVDIGVDADLDGVLRLDEVTDSFVVCNGADGAPGVDGRDGLNGVDGEDGLPGANGANGADGAPGPQGPAGENGKDGEPGFVDANGDGIDDRAAITGAGANCAQAGAALPLMLLALLLRRPFRLPLRCRGLPPAGGRQ